jgi:hypothetical protein
LGCNDQRSKARVVLETAHASPWRIGGRWHANGGAGASSSRPLTFDFDVNTGSASRPQGLRCVREGRRCGCCDCAAAKAKLAGMWREKVDQHNTGPVYERIERVIVERAPQSSHDDAATEAVREIGEQSDFTEVTRDFGMPRRHWSA